MKISSLNNKETLRFILKLGAFFGCGVLFLAVMHDQVYAYGKYPDSWLAQAFDMNGEQNFPTWFSSIAWAGVGVFALLCFWIEGKLPKGKTRFYWLVIAAAFFAASCDDIATIHEQLGLYWQDQLDASLLGQHIHQTAVDSPWLMFYIVPIITFLVASAVFIWSRFKPYPILLWLTAFGGACYLLALGCEQYQGIPQWQCCEIARTVHIPTRPLLNFSILLEECLEILGSTLLMMAFSGYCFEKGSHSANTSTCEALRDSVAIKDD